MQPANPPTPLPAFEEARLESADAKVDDLTEAAIKALADSYNVIGLDRKSHARQINAGAALRSRIRTLIEEARREAYIEGYTVASAGHSDD